MFITKVEILSISSVGTRIQGENSLQLAEKKGPCDFCQNEVCPDALKDQYNILLVHFSFEKFCLSCQAATTKGGQL
jgi:hypothetical protein